MADATVLDIILYLPVYNDLFDLIHNMLLLDALYQGVIGHLPKLARAALTSSTIQEADMAEVLASALEDAALRLPGQEIEQVKARFLAWFRQLRSVYWRKPWLRRVQEWKAQAHPHLAPPLFTIVTYVFTVLFPEYAAACAGGVMVLADGIKLVAARGRLMESLPQKGVMAAVFADEATVSKAIALYAGQVSIAVINGPTNIVISGNAQAVEAILNDLTAQGIKSRRLDVAQASHSPVVDPMLDEFEAIAATITYREPRTTYISSLTCQPLTRIDARYWRTHQRQPVRFGEALQTLLNQGFNCLVEIGPAPTLITIAQRNLDGSDVVPACFPSLRKGQDDWAQMLGSLGGLFIRGAAVDWRCFDQPYPRTRVNLPTYPFQRQSYWITPTAKRRGSQGGDLIHPLIGARIRSAGQEVIFENEISAQQPAFLADHVVQDQPVYPATGYLEIFLAAARTKNNEGHDAYRIEDLVIHAPLRLVDAQPVTEQTILNPRAEKGAVCQIFSYDKPAEKWHLHAAAVVGALADEPPAVMLADIQARCTVVVSVDDHYQHLAERGLHYGPAFRGMKGLWTGKGEVLAHIELPEVLSPESTSYILHPAVLDATLQCTAALLPPGSKTYLPMSVETVNVYGQPGTSLWSYAVLQTELRPGGEIVKADVAVYDDSGRMLVSLSGFAMKQAAQFSLDSWLYEIEWRKARKASNLSPEELVDLLQPAFDGMAGTPEMVAYSQEFTPRMDALCAALIQNALLDMGWSYAPGTLVERDLVAVQLGCIDQHRRLLNRLLEVMEEEGVLTRQGGGWQVNRVFQRIDAAALADSLRAAYPQTAVEVDLVERIGGELGPAMQGKRDALELLFPGGSLDEMEKLYRDAPYTRNFNLLVAQAVRSLAQNWCEGRPLKILEIGAGTGGTTAHVLDQLSSVQAEYTFTDISPLFLNKARQKFSKHSFVQYRTLDIEQDPLSQGFEARAYDLILATNVLHAAPVLVDTVRRVQQLLAPGGLLLAVEGVRKQRFADLIVGLMSGWWAFSDTTLRPDYALISQPHWLALLDETGMASAQALTGQTAMSNQVLLIAQAHQAFPVQEGASWMIFTGAHPIGVGLSARLRGQNYIVIPVRFGETFNQQDGHYQVSALRADDFHRLIRSVDPCQGVIYLWALDFPANSADAQSVQSAGLLHLAQALVASGKTCPIWVVTQGAQQAGGRVTAPHQATLWGLCKVINQEFPELACRVIDLDPDPLAANEDQLDHLWAEISAPDGEDQIAFRDNERLLPRLVRA
jgi:acyl transferase domain-containing protein